VNYNFIPCKIPPLTKGVGGFVFPPLIKGVRGIKKSALSKHQLKIEFYV